MNPIKNSHAFLSSALLITTTCFAGNDKNLPKDFSPKQNNAIAFTENKGQVYDQNYKARPDVLYGAMAGNLAVHIKKTGVSYQLYRVETWKEVEDPKTNEKRKEIDEQIIYRIDLNWLNANTNFNQSTDEALPGYNNYYLESCPNGALYVKSYTGITLNNLYNGINLHYYEKNGELKHDYIVAPHADYKQIQVKVEGAEVSVNKDGTLTLKTPLGEVQEGRPIVFQQGRELKANWQLENNVLSFYIENVNPNYELIIDPVTRLWGTYYGGSGNEWGNSCSSDANGNVYLAGQTGANAGTVIATTGAHQTLHGGTWDGFLVKFDASGLRLWGTYYGGSGSDYGYSCASDASGNVYLAGLTQSNTGTVIATAGAHQSVHGGNLDAFLLKFNTSGVRLWGTYYGGSGFDYGSSCTTDAIGNVYLAGYTDSNTGTVIATAVAHQSVYGGGTYDGFLVKFNTSGLRIWGTYYGGSGIDYGHSCASDAIGNVYLAGRTSPNTGTVIATTGVHQSLFGGGTDAFLVKFNASGIRLWGTYYGGSGTDYGYSCSSDAIGNVYLAGQTVSNAGTVIATAGGHQAVYGGGTWDGFLVKFDASGQRLWGTYYGGSGNDFGWFCSNDLTGNVYLAGFTLSNTGTVIATAGAHQSVHGGNLDAFLVKFNANGVRQWGTYYGGSGTEYGYSCSSDAIGNVYLAGYTDSNTGTVIATAGAHQSVHGGNAYDGFLVKLTDCVAITPAAAVNSTVCAGSSINFSVSINATVSPGYSWNGPNTFTSNVQNPVIASSGTANIGVYTVSVNNSGCVETATTQVTTINPLPTISVNNGTICSGNSFTIVPSGANTYTIQGGNAVVSPNANTSFTVRGTSTQGCISANTATSNLTVNTTPTVTVNNGTICSGNSFTIIPSGANTYTIQGGNSVVSPNASTSYTVRGTSTQGCISVNTATSNVTVYTSPTITVNNGTICSGESFTISPSGANAYTIQGGNSVVSPNSNTSYTVKGISTQGCISVNTATSNLTVNATPTIAVNNGTICSGESFTIVPSGANTYTIQGGSNIVSPNTSTSYTVGGSSTQGCISANTATSNLIVNITPTVSVNSGTICSGESFTIVASGANTYTIQGGSNIVNPNTNSSYTVAGSSSEGCLSVNNATSNVTVNVSPTISINNGTICAGQSFTIVPSGASTYTIQGGNSVVSPNTSSSYTVSGSSSDGCLSVNSATSNVNVNPLPIINISATSTVICLGESINLNASGANSYTWSTGANNSSISVSPVITTTYTVTGQDANTCENTVAIVLQVDACTGITSNIKPVAGIKLYPNPNNGDFYIETPQSLGVSIYNSLGQLILQQKLNEGKNQINLNEYSNGIYFIEINQNGKTNRIKLIKEH